MNFSNPFRLIDTDKIKEKVIAESVNKEDAENGRSFSRKKELSNLEKLQESLKKISPKKQDKKLAFLVTFKNLNDIIYISFKSNRARANWDACKYFRDLLIPEFQKDKGYSAQLKLTKVRRIREFDKYADEGKVPIPELMKVLNFKFPCSICGKGMFSYTDYIAKRCFILEGEHNLSEFVKGIVLCYNCCKKYI